MTKYTYQNSKTFIERKSEYNRLQAKYLDRIPVIISVIDNLPNIEKRKYLVPIELTVGQFVYLIRKSMKLDPSKALFVYSNYVLLQANSQFGEITNKYKSMDGFLYMHFSGENTFG